MNLPWNTHRRFPISMEVVRARFEARVRRSKFWLITACILIGAGVVAWARFGNPSVSDLVIGGTGFIGRHLVARLCADQHQIVVPTRLVARGRDLQLLPTVTLMQADVHDDAALAGPCCRAGCQPV